MTGASRLLMTRQLNVNPDMEKKEKDRRCDLKMEEKEALEEKRRKSEAASRMHEGEKDSAISASV